MMVRIMHINLCLLNSLFDKIERGPMNTGNLRSKKKKVEGTRDTIECVYKFQEKE